VPGASPVSFKYDKEGEKRMFGDGGELRFKSKETMRRVFYPRGKLEKKGKGEKEKTKEGSPLG